MGWRAAFFRVTYLFTKTKQQFNDADAIGAGDSAPETKRNDEKSVVQGGGPGRAEAGRGDDDADAVVVAPELKTDVPVSPASSTDMAAAKDDDGEAPEQERRMRQRTLQTTTTSRGSGSTTSPWQFLHLFRVPRLSNAGSTVQDRLSPLIATSWIHEIGLDGRSFTTTNLRKRLHELVKKTILLKFVLLVALLSYEPSFSSNAWFMMSLQACILAFVTDIFSAVTLINLTATVPVCWHCFLACFSGASTTLVPYFLLVSLDKLSAYVILIAVPLPVTVVALVNCVWAPAPADEVDDDDLDHVFDVSSAITNVAAGGGLTGTIFGYSISSLQPPVAGPLGFLLFFTISLGVYLMLVATVRPISLARHAERLMYILLALLAATAFVAAVDFAGWWLACAVASIDVIEVAVFTLLAKVLGAVTATTSSDEEDAGGRKNEQRLTSIVIATVLFTLVMQLHSQKAGDSSLGQYEVLRMMLYLAAFLWSFNRILFFHEEAAGRRDGRGAAGVWAWLWSAVQLARTTVVVLAVLDHVYYNYYAKLLEK